MDADGPAGAARQTFTFDPSVFFDAAGALDQARLFDWLLGVERARGADDETTLAPGAATWLLAQALAETLKATVERFGRSAADADQLARQAEALAMTDLLMVRYLIVQNGWDTVFPDRDKTGEMLGLR